MTFKEFITKYHPIKNTYDPSSMMGYVFETDDEEQEEFVENKSPNLIWSYTDDRKLINGMHYSGYVLGYIVCKEPESAAFGTKIVEL